MSALERLPEEILPGATETALALPENLDESEWRAVGVKLGRAHRASGWWIGDWVNYGEKKWGEKYDEAERITGLAYDTLRRYAKVAARFAIRERIPNCSFSHHQLVAPIADIAERQNVLARAANEGWDRARFRTELAPRKPTSISPKRRHTAYVDTAGELVRVGEKWERSMTDALTPPQARKQLTILNKAAERLAEVIEAVEYRAATPHQFMGR